MATESWGQILLICLLAFVILLAVFGPPAWWYWRDRKPNDRTEKRWALVLLGVWLMLQLGGLLRPTAKGDWIGWSKNLGILMGSSWLFAWVAKKLRTSDPAAYFRSR